MRWRLGEGGGGGEVIMFHITGIINLKSSKNNAISKKKQKSLQKRVKDKETCQP